MFPADPKWICSALAKLKIRGKLSETRTFLATFILWDSFITHINNFYTAQIQTKYIDRQVITDSYTQTKPHHTTICNVRATLARAIVLGVRQPLLILFPFVGEHF